MHLKLIDDPVAARDAYAAGESHVLWGTLDMIVLFAGELMKDGVTTFVEIGPGNVLSGLVKRIDRSVRTITVNDLASLEKAKEALAAR